VKKGTEEKKNLRELKFTHNSSFSFAPFLVLLLFIVTSFYDSCHWNEEKREGERERES
jgi:hypothetical protein